MSTKQVSVSPLAAVTLAAFNAAKSTALLKDAFVKAGGNQDAPRQALIVGRMMFSLNYTQEKALLALGKKGRGKNPDDAKLTDDVRTASEEKAYGAARVYLSARLKEWGLATTSAQGGDRSKDSDAMDTEKLVTAGKPKVNTSPELGAYSMAYAKAGYDFFLLNKGHSAVTSEHGSELMGAFADLCAAIAEINSKYAK